MLAVGTLTKIYIILHKARVLQTKKKKKEM